MNTAQGEDSFICKGWLKVVKVAKSLDCSKAQVYDLIQEGELDAFKHNQTLRVSVESLEAFIKRHRIEPAQGTTTTCRGCPGP